ncbi:MAG: hypothetical protein JWL62_1949 [Hyphomicrobiales bacterium]|nr:hypothetical protein [Hyphomicrobiales bacterium]
MLFFPRSISAAFRLLAAAVVVVVPLGGAAAAGVNTSAVSVGGTKASLLLPAKPRASLILLTGGTGRVEIDAGGEISYGGATQLVRTRDAYAARGYAVLVPDVGFDLNQLVAYMAQIKRPVIVAGTSRGTQRAARGIAAGARPDKLVLTSGFLSDESGDRDNVMNILGNPGLLPPTLIIHHRQDACRKTAPAGVAPFQAWAGARAKVTWLSGGSPQGDACEAHASHGFNGIDGQVVSAISAFSH